MEYEEFRMIHNDQDLSQYLKTQINPAKDNYLFIDEIQDIDHFEHTLRDLQAKDSCDIFCTGSNAKMLSGELATYLSGRYIEFHIHSLSYPGIFTFSPAPRRPAKFDEIPYLRRIALSFTLGTEWWNGIWIFA